LIMNKMHVFLCSWVTQLEMDRDCKAVLLFVKLFDWFDFRFEKLNDKLNHR